MVPPTTYHLPERGGGVIQACPDGAVHAPLPVVLVRDMVVGAAPAVRGGGQALHALALLEDGRLKERSEGGHAAYEEAAAPSHSLPGRA